MRPATSLLVFTTLSGLGLGLLFWLGLDPDPPLGWRAAVVFAGPFALVLAGLAASALHLARPERALLAFTQWRTSWLSREAWAVLAALLCMGGFVLGLMLGLPLRPLGWLGAALSLATVAATSMIYARLKTVPRWHHWSTPALFLLLALTGGGLLLLPAPAPWLLLLVCGGLQIWVWRDGDRRFARSGTTLASATGLGAGGGTPRALFPPHSGTNYLTDEMIHVVGRRHAAKLRVLSLLLMVALPVALVQLPLVPLLFDALALVSHVAGVLVSRWLFFAEAEHVVGLYYGRR